MATANKKAQAPRAKAEDQPTATYTVLSPLEHDQDRYEPGDVIELTEAQAAPLLGHTVKAQEDAPQE